MSRSDYMRDRYVTGAGRRSDCFRCHGPITGASPTYCKACMLDNLHKRRAALAKKPKKSTVELLWDKVRWVGAAPESCWEFEGAKNDKGYGVFRAEGRGTLAHRTAWEFSNQDRVPSGMLVCHRCDNPACCNPDHLFIGSSMDNTADMVAKGRSRFWGIQR